MHQETKRIALAAPPGLASGSSRVSFASSAASTSASPQQAVPHELRTEAMISGLGHNLSSEDLLARAAEVLKEAAIPDDWHDGVTTNRRGTAVFPNFREPGQLRLASNKVRRLAAAEGEPKPWLDARRTRSENRPNRCIHRAAEAIAELNLSITKEGKVPPFPSNALTKNMRRLCVQNGQDGVALCYYNARTQDLAWTRECEEAYKTLDRQDDLFQIAAWCSLE